MKNDTQMKLSNAGNVHKDTLRKFVRAINSDIVFQIDDLVIGIVTGCHWQRNQATY